MIDRIGRIYKDPDGTRWQVIDQKENEMIIRRLSKLSNRFSPALEQLKTIKIIKSK